MQSHPHPHREGSLWGKVQTSPNRLFLSSLRFPREAFIKKQSTNLLISYLAAYP